jgi:hypothetical protein
MLVSVYDKVVPAHALKGGITPPILASALAGAGRAVQLKEKFWKWAFQNFSEKI